MATVEFAATIGTVTASAGGASAIGASSTAATAADTAVGVVVGNLTTAFTDYDTFAAAVIAITGDTYDGNVTKAFTFGGAGNITHAQWATVGALLNTAVATDFLNAQTNAGTAKTATAAAVTAATPTADLTLFVGSVANVGDMNKLRNGMRAIEYAAEGTSWFAKGSGNPRPIG